MSTPVSFAIRPPPEQGVQASANGSANGSVPSPSGGGNAAPFRISAPIRPSPLSRSSTGVERNGQGQGNRAGWGQGSGRGRGLGGRGLGDAASDEEDEEDGRAPGRARGSGPGRGRRDEQITGFSEDGIESLRKAAPAGPMIIPALPNKDWRNSSLVTRKPTYMPDSRAGRVVKPEHLVERTGDEAVVAGLQLTGSRARAALATGQDPVAVKLEPGAEASGSGSADVSDFDSNAADSPMAHVKLEEGSATPPLPAAEETLEQKAIKALLDGGDGEVKPDLVIKMDEDTLDLRNMPADETDAFRRDVIMRPAESTLDDYEATPIEAFGEALLRGMGWQPGAAGGTKIHEPKRRPDGLGLGAKERPAAGAGNGAGPAGKGKGKVDRSKRLGRGYVPVIKRERDPAPSGSDLSRTGTPSRASSRSPDSKDGRDSRRRRDDRDEERAAVPRGERDRDERYSDSKDDRRDRDRERDRDERRRDRDNRPRDRDSDRDDSRRSERPEVDRRRRDDDGHTRRHRDDRDAERYRSRDGDRDGRRSDRERDDRDRYRERR